MTQAGRPDDGVDEGSPEASGGARVPAPRPAGGTVYGGKPAEGAPAGRASVPGVSGRASVPSPGGDAGEAAGADGAGRAAGQNAGSGAAVPAQGASPGGNEQQAAGVTPADQGAGRAIVTSGGQWQQPSAGRAVVSPADQGQQGGGAEQNGGAGQQASAGRASVPAQAAPASWASPQGGAAAAPPNWEQPEQEQTGGEGRKGRGRLVAVLLSVLLLIGLVGAGTGVQLTRDLPPATLTTSVTETLRIPGKAATLPWPKQGSAELMIEGLGRLGGSGKSTTPKAIGSVAKVMTAYVILKNHPLQAAEEGPSITVTAADVADYQRRIPMNQSLVTIKAGTKLTERDALEALMLPSANNVAHMLAVWDAGSEAAFVEKMNDAATELGMKNTEYTDPSGYLPTTVSTAPDQILLGRAALALPAFAEIVELPESTIPVAGKIKNYNDLLGEQGVFGIKTGSTDEAGGCLLFASRITVGDRKLVLVGAVFNQPGANTPEQLAAVNKVVRRLLTAVGKTVKSYEILPASPVGQVKTAWGSTAGVSPAEPLTVVGWPGLAVPVRVTRFEPGPGVTQGQAVGAVEARPGASAVRVSLRADATTTDPSLWWKLTRRP